MNDLFMIQAELSRIKGLVAGLYRLFGDTAAAAAGTVPTIDFAVDMFDRADADTLGPYWENAGAFVIRLQEAVPAAGEGVATSVSGGSGQGPGVNVTQMAKAFLLEGVVGSSIGGYALQYATHDARELFLGGAIGAMKSSYKGLFAGTGLTCKISFFAADNNPVYVGHGVVSGEPAVTPEARISPIATAGLSVSDENDGKGVVALASAITAFAEVPGGTGDTFPDAVTVSETIYNVMPADVHVGSLTGAVVGASNLYDPAGTISSGTVEGPDLRWYSDYGRLSTLVSVVPGENTITLSIDGTTVSATLNGAPIASFTSSATSPPRRMGLAAAAIDMLAAFDYLGIEAYGILSFKAWRTDTGEPPSESGHGTFSSSDTEDEGTRVYQDKYHTAIVEDGVVTGYTYNPNA